MVKGEGRLRLKKRKLELGDDDSSHHKKKPPQEEEVEGDVKEEEDLPVQKEMDEGVAADAEVKEEEEEAGEEEEPDGQPNGQRQDGPPAVSEPQCVHSGCVHSGARRNLNVYFMKHYKFSEPPDEQVLLSQRQDPKTSRGDFGGQKIPRWERSKIEQEMRSLKEENGRMKEEMTELLEILAHQEEEAAQELAKAQVEIQAAKKKKRHAQRRMEEMQNEMVEREEKEKQLRDELETVKGEVRGLQTEKECLQADLKRAEESVMKLEVEKKECDDLTQRREAESIELKAANGRLTEECEKAVEALRGAEVTLNAAMDQQMQEHEGLIASQKRQLSDLQTEMECLQADLKRAEEYVKKLELEKKECDELTQRREAESIELQAENGRLTEECEKAVEALRGAEVTHKAAMDRAAKASEELMAQFAVKEGEWQLREQRGLAEVKQCREMIESQKKELKKSEAEKEIALEKVKSFQKQLEQLNEQRYQMALKEQDSMALLKECHDVIERQRKDLVEWKAANGRLTQECEKAVEALAAAREKASQFEKDLKAMQAKCAKEEVLQKKSDSCIMEQVKRLLEIQRAVSVLEEDHKTTKENEAKLQGRLGQMSEEKKALETENAQIKSTCAMLKMSMENAKAALR